MCLCAFVAKSAHRERLNKPPKINAADAANTIEIKIQKPAIEIYYFLFTIFYLRCGEGISPSNRGQDVRDTQGRDGLATIDNRQSTIENSYSTFD
ncbi:MAG: hypothetical protein A2Z25_10275 [Planctomycetes bacterium RBG_16_55_9]|nr:MAG: hypothetical protein A2Z25_10275 [Planctomycetes bacterium RBG_16_55_9]